MTRRRFSRVWLASVDWEHLFVICPQARRTDANLQARGFRRRGRVGRARLRNGSVSYLAIWTARRGCTRETFSLRFEDKT